MTLPAPYIVGLGDGVAGLRDARASVDHQPTEEGSEGEYPA